MAELSTVDVIRDILPNDEMCNVDKLSGDWYWQVGRSSMEVLLHCLRGIEDPFNYGLPYWRETLLAYGFKKTPDAFRRASLVRDTGRIHMRQNAGDPSAGASELRALVLET